jgi:hypothetical protein
MAICPLTAIQRGMESGAQCRVSHIVNGSTCLVAGQGCKKSRELDEDSQWLTLIPHPLSPTSARRWKYGTEAEGLGRVVSVVTRLGYEF